MGALAPGAELRLAAPRRLLRLRSDAALADRFAGGDDAAFAVLYERHRASVLAVCIGVLGSRHDAEDAAQEAFASLAVTLRRSPPRELRPWLATVARNASIDLARRRREHPSSDQPALEPVAPAGSDGAELDSVIAGIRELPESQRTALLMRELAGYSYAEIAAVLEVEEDSVRGLIARARIGLRDHRAATELPCATARTALAAEPDGRRQDKTVRRHLRGCASCRAYRQDLLADARALRGLAPMQAGGLGGGALAGSLAAKGALMGGALTQATAACALSVCTFSGFVLLYTHNGPLAHPRPAAHVVSKADLDRGAHRTEAHAAAAPAAGAFAAPSATAIAHTPAVGAASHSSGTATRPRAVLKSRPRTDSHSGAPGSHSGGSRGDSGAGSPGDSGSAGSGSQDGAGGDHQPGRDGGGDGGGGSSGSGTPSASGSGGGSDGGGGSGSGSGGGGSDSGGSGSTWNLNTGSGSVTGSSSGGGDSGSGSGSGSGVSSDGGSGPVGRQSGSGSDGGSSGSGADTQSGSGD